MLCFLNSHISIIRLCFIILLTSRLLISNEIPNIVISLNDLLKFGSKTITVDKTGFKSNEKYVFRAVPNLNFNFSNLNFNINLGDSLIGYQNRLLPNYNEPLVGNNEPIYTNTPPFEVIVEYYKDDVIQTFPYNASNQIIDVDFNKVNGGSFSVTATVRTSAKSSQRT